MRSILSRGSRKDFPLRVINPYFQPVKSTVIMHPNADVWAGTFVVVWCRLPARIQNLNGTEILSTEVSSGERETGNAISP